MNAWQLRALEAGDHRAAIDLWNACEGVRASETSEEFARILARNDGLSGAAVAGESGGGELVGAVLCCHDGRRGYLYHLGVAAKWRRHGIGAALVDRSLGLLRETGIGRCSIHVIVGNEAGKAFWLSNRWRLRTDLEVLAIDL